MTFTVPTYARQSLYGNAAFFDLERGVDAYSSLRLGDTVEGTCGGAKVTATVEKLEIGPLGQFFAPGSTHVSCLGRGLDVRALTDSVEAKDLTDDPKAVDPRELYTAIHLRVVSVNDPSISMPGMPTMPAPVA